MLDHSPNDENPAPTGMSRHGVGDAVKYVLQHIKRGFHKSAHMNTFMNETTKKGVPAVAMTGTPQRFYLLLAALTLQLFVRVYRYFVLWPHVCSPHSAVSRFGTR